METIIEDLIYVFIFLVKTHDTRKNGFKLPRKTALYRTMYNSSLAITL